MVNGHDNESADPNACCLVKHLIMVQRYPHHIPGKAIFGSDRSLDLNPLQGLTPRLLGRAS